ncbi:MAG: divalent metal cation transporter [Patescibacteria group bacterium]|nr:divalent metal cation transporter [Patescibacteria group bacterium]
MKNDEKDAKGKIWDKLGPGFITGASDDDPSGIATYTQVGAQFGLAQLWTTLMHLPLMIAIQEMVGRIGMVAGEGLVSLLRKHYGRPLVWLVVFLVFIANTINIGSDLGAMADATRLLIPAVPFSLFLIGYTVLILILEIFLSYKTYASVLKWLALSLLGYLLTAFIVTTDWRQVLLAAVSPTFSFERDFVIGIVALLGTTISPYLFIWQANEEIEEEIAAGRTTIRQRKGASKQEISTMRRDTAVGMGFSQTITFFIIVTATNTFFVHGLHDIQTTAQAAEALEPLAGSFASYIFALGIVGTGMLAVPVLSASASYALSEALKWHSGLYKKLKQAHGFYGAITIATLIGLLINFSGLNPIKALYWAAVFNGIITPPLVLIILMVANNKKIMGKWANGRWSNVFGGLTFLATSAAVILMFML